MTNPARAEAILQRVLLHLMHADNYDTANCDARQIVARLHERAILAIIDRTHETCSGLRAWTEGDEC